MDRSLPNKRFAEPEQSYGLHWFHQRKCVLHFLNESVRFNKTPKVVTICRDCHNILLLHLRVGVLTYESPGSDRDNLSWGHGRWFQRTTWAPETRLLLSSNRNHIVDNHLCGCSRLSSSVYNRTELFPSLDCAILGNPPGSSTERISKPKNI